ncbi:MAG: sugar phosphate nucleotidyltransferase [Alphaproteobacteria bacterium]
MSGPALSEVTALILAGGKGTRIASLYPDIPKPMIPLNGQPFLYWVIRWVMRQGIRRIVISTGHLAEKIEEWVETNPFGDDVEIICRRENKPLGTAGGIRNCLDLLGEWTLVTNGDSLIDADIKDAIVPKALGGFDTFIFGVMVDDTSRFGSLQVGQDNLLKNFAEKVSGNGLINSGIYLLSYATIAAIPEHDSVSIERDTFPEMLERHKKIEVRSLGSAKFIDIGTPESVAEKDLFLLGKNSFT